MLTDLELKRAIRRLAVVFPKKRRTDEMLPEWRQPLRDLNPQQLANAVEAYLTSGDSYFPTPSQLRKLALGESTRYKPPTALPPEDEKTFFPKPGELRELWKQSGVVSRAEELANMAAPGKPCPEDPHERPCKNGCGEAWCFHAP